MIPTSLFVLFLCALAAADWRLARRFLLVRAPAVRSSRLRWSRPGIRPFWFH